MGFSIKHNLFICMIESSIITLIRARAAIYDAHPTLLKAKVTKCFIFCGCLTTYYTKKNIVILVW
jgi:hypothetical protein